MGRNSKKNKGRKPATEQGLKGAASLASSSSNVATAPPRPARTAKHKVRKSQPQATTTTSTQVNDSTKARGSQSIKEPQPVLSSLPPKDVNHKVENEGMLLSDTSTTRTSDSPCTSTAILTESPITDSSSIEREVTLPEPISTNLSDSYDSSSSSCETEMGVQNTDNEAEIPKIEEKGTMEPTQQLNILRQEDKEPKILVAGDSDTSLNTLRTSPDNLERKINQEQEPYIVIGSFGEVLLEDKEERPAEKNNKAANFAEEIESTSTTTDKDESPIRIHDTLPASPAEIIAQNEQEELKSRAENLYTSADAASEAQEMINEENASDGQTLNQSSKLLLAEEQEACQDLNQTTAKEQELQGTDAAADTNSTNQVARDIEVREEASPALDQQDNVCKPRVTEGQTEDQVAKLQEEAEAMQQADNELHGGNNMSASYEVQPLAKTNSQESDLGKEYVADEIDPVIAGVRELPVSTAELLCHAQVSTDLDHISVQAVNHEDDHLYPHIKQLKPLSDDTKLPEVANTQEVQAAADSLHSIPVEQEFDAKALSLEKGNAPQASEENFVEEHLIQPLQCDTVAEKQIALSELDRKEQNDQVCAEEEPSIEEQAEASACMEEKHEQQSLEVQKQDKVDEPARQYETVNEEERTELQDETEDTDVQAETQDVETSKNEEVEDVTDVKEGDATLQQQSNSHQKEVESDHEDHINKDAKDCKATEQEQHISENEDDATADLQAAQSVIPEEATTFETHNPLKTSNDCQENPDKVYNGSVYEEQTTNCVENQVEKVEVDETEVDEENQKLDDVKPDQLDKGTVCEGHATNSIESEMEKPEEVELEVSSIMLNKEKPDQAHDGSVCEEHKTTDSLENKMEKPDVGEPQVESVTLDTDWACQDGKFDQVCSDSVCEEHTRSVDNEIEKHEVGETEVAVPAHDVKESQEAKPSQLNDACSCVEDKPDVDEPKVESAALEEKEECQEEMFDQVDSGYVCKENATNSAEDQLEKLDVKEQDRECQEDKPDQQLDRSTVCEGDATISVESEMKKLEVGEREVDCIALDNEKCQQEKPDHAHNESVCQEDKAMEKLVEEEPLIEGDKDHECQEEQPNQQLDRGILSKGYANSIESEMEKLNVQEPEGEVTTLSTEGCMEEKTESAHTGSFCEEHKTRVFLENHEMPDAQVEGVTLDKDQEYQGAKPDQVDRESRSQGHTKSSVENEVEKLEVGESEIAIAIGEEREYPEEHTINCVENGMEQLNPEVESAALEEKSESPEEMPDQVESGHVCEEHEMHTVENELEKPRVEEPEVESVVCEEHQRPEDAIEMPDVEEPQVEDDVLGKDQVSQEEKPEQKDSDSVCKEHPTSSLESEIEKLEVGESERTIAPYQEREYQEENSCQLNVCDKHNINSVETAMEKPQVKEPEVETAVTEEKKESQEETSDQIESERVNNEHETKSVEVSEVGDPKLEGVTLHQMEEHQEGEADQVSGCFVEQQLTDKNLEKYEVGEPQVGLALKEKEEFQPEQADHDSVCEEHAPISAASDLQEVEVGEPEAGVNVLDKVDCQEEESSQVHRGSMGEEHTTNLLENELGKPEVEEPEVGGVMLEEEKLCQEEKPVNVEDGCHHTTSFLESEMEKLEMDEPEAEAATIDKEDCQEEEPCQLHQEEHTTNSSENEMEKLEVGQPEGSDKENQCQEEKPADIENVSQGRENTTRFSESEMDKLKVEDLEVTLEEKKECQDEKPRQLDSGSACQELEVGEQEEKSAALEGQKECQEEDPEQVASGCVSEEHATKSKGTELDREPEAGVTLDQMMCQEEIDSSPVCEEHPTISVEHQMEKLEVGKPQEEYLEKEECHEEKPDQIDSSSVCGEHPTVEHETEKLEVGKPQEEKEDSDRVSSGTVCKEHAANSAEGEIEKFEVGDKEVDCVLLNNEERQKENPDGGSICEEYMTKSVENMENLEVGDSEIQSVVLDEKKVCEEENPDLIDHSSVNEEQTRDFVENATEESEVEVPEVEDTMLDDEECLREKADQVTSSSASEERTIDSEENHVDKPEVTQSEPGGIIALEESKECQEEITDDVDNGSTCETQKAEVEGVPLDENKEWQEGKPDEVNASTSVSEAHTVDSVENETEKPEVGVPEVENKVLDEKECQIEEPDQAESSSGCEEHAADSIEDDMDKLEVNQPAVENPDQVDSRPMSEAHTADFVEDEAERPEVGVPEVEDNVRQSKEPGQDKNSSVCEEHATDSKEDGMDKFEVKQSEAEVYVQDNKECQSEIPDQAKSSSVCEERAPNIIEDDMDQLEVNQTEVAKPDQVDGSTSVSEAHTAESAENDTEKLEVGVPEVEDDVLAEKECLSENFYEANSSSYVCEQHATEDDIQVNQPEVEDNMVDETECDQAKSSSVCEEHGIGTKEDDMDKLEANQPDTGKPDQVDGGRSVREEHTIDSVENETEKPELGVSDVEDNVLDEKECPSEKPGQAKSSSVSEEHATDSKEDDMDKLEVNPPEVGKLDQVANSKSESEAQAENSVENEPKKPEVGVSEVEDNMLDEKECQSEETEQAKSSSVCEEIPTDSKEVDVDKLEVNQPEVEKPDQVDGSRSLSEVHSADFVENGTERPQVGIEDKMLHEEECQTEEPDQHKSSCVCEEHATDSKEDGMEMLEVKQPEVQSEKPDQAQSSSVYEEHAANSTEDGMVKLEVSQPEVEDNVLEEKECQSEKPDQATSSSVGEEQATDSKEDGMDKLEVNQPEEAKPDPVDSSTSVSETHTAVEKEIENPDLGVPEVEDDVLDKEDQSADLGVSEVEDDVLDKEDQSEKPDQAESSSVYEECATDSKEDDMDKLEVSQPEVEKPDQVDASGSVSEGHTADSVENAIEKPLPEVEDTVLEEKDCQNERTDQAKSSSVCEEHATDPKEDGMDKPEVNQPEVEDNVLDEKECQSEKPQYVEHGIHSKEDGMDTLEVNQPEIEHEKETVCEEHEWHATDSKEDDMDKLGANQPEVGQPDHDTSSRYVREAHTAETAETETEKPEVGVPEVEDDMLDKKECHNEKPEQAKSGSVCEEHSSNSKEDGIENLEANQPEIGGIGLDKKHECQEGITNEDDNSLIFEKEIEKEKQEVTKLEVEEEHTEKSVKNDNAKVDMDESNIDGVALEKKEECQDGNPQKVEQPDVEKSQEEMHKMGGSRNTDEELDRNLELKAIEVNLICEEITPVNAKSQEDMEVKDLPESDEIEFRQISEMSHGSDCGQETPRLQEDANEVVHAQNSTENKELMEVPLPKVIEFEQVLEQLNTVKHEEAKQEPMHHLDPQEEDQEVNLIDAPALNHETQKSESDEVNPAIPLENNCAPQDEHIVNLTTDGQEVEAKEISTHIDEQTGQFQGMSLVTLAPAEPQAQEAIPGGLGDGGIEFSTIQSSPSYVEETLLDIKQHNDGAHEQHSPQSVVEQPESPAENENKDGIPEVAVTNYQLHHAELSNDKDVQSQDTDQTNLNEKQSGQEVECEEITALPVHEEQSIFEVEQQVSCTEGAGNNTSDARCKELAPTEDDGNAEKMMVMPEILGEPNQNIHDASDTSKESETEQLPDEAIQIKRQQNNDPNSTEHVSLHLHGIHKQVAPTLSENEQQKIARIDEVKGEFQTVKETSAALEEQKGEPFDIEEMAPVQIPLHNYVTFFEKPPEPAGEELVFPLGIHTMQVHPLTPETPQITLI